MVNPERKNVTRESMVQQKNGIYHWQIADLLGMRADTFSKKLRYELPEDEQELIVEIIKKHCKEVKNNE